MPENKNNQSAYHRWIICGADKASLNNETKYERGVYNCKYSNSHAEYIYVDKEWRYVFNDNRPGKPDVR